MEFKFKYFLFYFLISLHMCHVLFLCLSLCAFPPLLIDFDFHMSLVCFLCLVYVSLCFSLFQQSVCLLMLPSAVYPCVCWSFGFSVFLPLFPMFHWPGCCLANKTLMPGRFVLFPVILYEFQCIIKACFVMSAFLFGVLRLGHWLSHGKKVWRYMVFYQQQYAVSYARFLHDDYTLVLILRDQIKKYKQCCTL